MKRWSGLGVVLVALVAAAGEVRADEGPPRRPAPSTSASSAPASSAPTASSKGGCSLASGEGAALAFVPAALALGLLATRRRAR